MKKLKEESEKNEKELSNQNENLNDSIIQT